MYTTETMQERVRELRAEGRAARAGARYRPARRPFARLRSLGHRRQRSR